MENRNPNLQILYPFAQARKSKALADEDAFMQEHGGLSARMIFFGVDKIGAVIMTIAAAPLNLLLNVIQYDSPLQKPQNAKKPSATNTRKFSRSKGAGQRKSALKRYPDASSFRDPKSTSRRRA